MTTILLLYHFTALACHTGNNFERSVFTCHFDKTELYRIDKR